MKWIAKARIAMFLMILSELFLPGIVKSQDESQEKLISESKDSKASFLKADPSMEKFFKSSPGYVIFPDIGKGALIVGGGGGKGVVYEQDKPVGTAKMVQITVGAQAGGQAYEEIIFFENKAALDRFKQDKTEFSAQTSAIAAASGASADANYREGVIVFTKGKGGLMAEASIGGQKFSFQPLK
jgi:lipid-binding SYLF domain-containing protein